MFLGKILPAITCKAGKVLISLCYLKLDASNKIFPGTDDLKQYWLDCKFKRKGMKSIEL